MAVKSGFCSIHMAFEFVLVSAPRGLVLVAPPQPPPPRALSMLVAYLPRPLFSCMLSNFTYKKRVFISTCHNKVDDGRQLCQHKVYCLIGGFVLGASLILGCHFRTTIWGLL